MTETETDAHILNEIMRPTVQNNHSSKNCLKKQILFGFLLSVSLVMIVVTFLVILTSSFRGRPTKSYLIVTKIRDPLLNGVDINSNNREAYLKLENTAMKEDQKPFEVKLGKSVAECQQLCASNSSCAVFSATALGMCRFFDANSINNYRNYTGINLYVKH